MGARRNQVATESQIQSAFVAWAKMAETSLPALKLAFSVPNGAWTKNYAMAAKLKREGMRSGVPDWMLPKVTRNGNGLAIEFKRPGAYCTLAQRIYHDMLRKQGWQVEVCSDWQQARQIVEKYLS